MPRAEGTAARAKRAPVAEIGKPPARAEGAPVPEVSKLPACSQGTGISSIRKRGVARAERSHVPAIAERAYVATGTERAHVTAVTERRRRGAGSWAEGAEPGAGRADRRSDAGLSETPGPEAIADILLLVGKATSLDSERAGRHAWMLDGTLGRGLFVLGFGDCAAGDDGTDPEQAYDEENSRIPPWGAHGDSFASLDT